MVVAIIIFVAAMSLLFYLSWSISLGFYLNSICSNERALACVALTYDDGVDPDLTPALLDLLDLYEAKATFCVIGERGLQYPQILQDIVHRGHTLVNHSMCHKRSFPMQSTSKIYKEILTCNSVLEEISGETMRYFRPPYGVTNPMIAKALRKTGLISLGWNIRSYDTMDRSSKRVIDRVTSQISGKGDIVLLHDNRAGVLEISEGILKYIKCRGYKALSVDELLKI